METSILSKMMPGDLFASTIVFSLHAKNPRRQKALTNNRVLRLVFIFSDFTVKII